MKTSKPLNDTAQWQRSDLQYPRLIAELLATGAFDTNVRTAICDSMDLEPHQLDELLRRAESDWTTIKQTILTSNKSASTLRCPHCNYNGKKPTDNGQGFRYLSDQTTWREVVKVEKGVLLVQGWSEIYDEDAEQRTSGMSVLPRRIPHPTQPTNRFLLTSDRSFTELLDRFQVRERYLCH